MKKHTKIAFIGGGNMASAMIDGLIKSGYKPEHLLASAPSKQTRHRLAEEFNINIAEKNNVAAYFADLIILAVKPNIIEQVSREIAYTLRSLGRKTPIISVAAGHTVDDLQAHFPNWPVGVAMPNLPSAVGHGLTGMLVNEQFSITQKKALGQVFKAIGEIVWLESEKQMPAIVALAGSAPAYFFLFLEIMKDVGIDMGLSGNEAKQAALQSGLGACQMALAADQDFKTLREQVTSPNGTTEKAINCFKANGLPEIVEQAMWAAANKASNGLTKSMTV